MIFSFKNKTHLEIVTGYDEKNDKVETEVEVFEAYEEIDGDIVNETELNVNIQFPDGSMVYNLLKADINFKSRKVRAFNIKYDTDEEEVDLPAEIVFENVSEDVDLEEEIANMISDKTGWCVSSVEYEIVK